MEITEKHIEVLVGHKIILLVNLCGSVKACFLGTIEGRLRSRFKHYIFKSDTPYTNFFFTPHDVRSIEQSDGMFYVKLGEAEDMDSENKKNRKKKVKTKVKGKKTKVKTKKAKKKSFSINLLGEKRQKPVIDLNDTLTLSAQASSEK